MPDPVATHYQTYPYPLYPLLASVRRCDTYAFNLAALWMRFNGTPPSVDANRILIAGCGTFAPYPCSLANPETQITALDLSEKSLKRARLHCLLHGRRNITYRCGDLLNDIDDGERFGLIDAFGVLHHLSDPLAGLQSLEQHLIPGGIVRIMLYSRYARREEQAIRQALRLLQINDPQRVRRLLKQARPGSRLAAFCSASDEIATESGLADALLHPRVKTYRIDQLLDMIRQTGLQPLLFAHHGAREQVTQEIERLRLLEQERSAPGNFIVYLGKPAATNHKRAGDTLLILNPCLVGAVSRFGYRKVQIPARIGYPNPALGWKERAFLRRFIRPVPHEMVPAHQVAAVAVYKRNLFLLEYRPCHSD